MEDINLFSDDYHVVDNYDLCEKVVQLSPVTSHHLSEVFDVTLAPKFAEKLIITSKHVGCGVRSVKLGITCRSPKAVKIKPDEFVAILKQLEPKKGN